MAGPKINLPPYDGTNSVELKEILIGSAAQFRSNLNNNTSSVADAVNLNTTAFSLWTKAWVENIGLIYWSGLQEEGLASGNTQVDVGYMQDIGVLTNIPKLINSYKVSVKYGSEHTKIEFDTHYRDENGQSVSYIDINKGINIVINSTQAKDSDNKYHRYINIANTSTATDVVLTMEIDQKASREWKNIIEQLSLDTLREITSEGQSQFNAVHNEGISQKQSVASEGQSQFNAVRNEGVSQKQSVAFEGQSQFNAVHKEGISQKQSVTSEGATQIGLISAQGTTSVNAVNTAGATQVDNVNTAGATQVGNVNNAGNTMISAIERIGASKFNVVYVGNQQGRENFEQTELENAHVYLWLDTGTASV